MDRSAALCRLLGITYPLVQAPMAGISTPELAAAVSEAGGLGSVAVGAVDVAAARAMIRAIKALTDRPFNVNVFCHAPAPADTAKEAAWLIRLAPYFAEFGAEPPAQLHEIYRSFVGHADMLAMLLEERPAVVSFHFGLPGDGVIGQLKTAGIVTLGCATSPEETALCVAAGVDAVVVQGIEAGGHRGVFVPGAADAEMTTADLVQAVAETCPLSLLAAGGIMDGADMARMLRLGAAGVQMGTAFVMCPESSASDAQRVQMQSPRAHVTQLTVAISGRRARGLANRMYGLPEADAPAYPRAYDAAKALHAAARAQGNFDFAAYWAGTGAPRARVMPAGELVQRLVEECAAA